MQKAATAVSGRPQPQWSNKTRMPSIIYPPTIDWHYLYQRPQQLMKALSQLGYRVFFCNSALGRNERPGLTRLGANLYLVAGTDPGPLAGNEPIIWISYPPHVRLLPRYKRGLVIFDAVDEPAEEFAHWAGDVDALRAEADAIFCSSHALYASHAGRHPNVHLCPNGADFKHFSQAAGEGPIPSDLARIPRPVVGYHGALANWLDWETIATVAAANPDYSFVFIGPLFTGGERVPQGANLYYLGHRDYRLLPSYLRGFDVGIIPFRLTPMTAACNPIKLWEYLAAGKPVVASPLPEASQYKEVLIAANPDEFSQCLRQALAAGDPLAVKERQSLARNNSWEMRALQIHKVLAAALAARARK